MRVGVRTSVIRSCRYVLFMLLLWYLFRCWRRQQLQLLLLLLHGPVQAGQLLPAQPVPRGSGDKRPQPLFIHIAQPGRPPTPLDVLPDGQQALLAGLRCCPSLLLHAGVCSPCRLLVLHVDICFQLLQLLYLRCHQVESVVCPCRRQRVPNQSMKSELWFQKLVSIQCVFCG